MDEAQLELETSDVTGAMIDVWFSGGRTGFDIAKQLRARASIPIPIVMMTGGTISDAWISDSAVEVEALLLKKPFRSSDCNGFLTSAAIFPLHLGRLKRTVVMTLSLTNELSPQEARILGYLAAGSTRASLANDAGVNRDTLKWQLKSLLRKTGVTDTTELISALLRAIGELDCLG